MNGKWLAFFRGRTKAIVIAERRSVISPVGRFTEAQEARGPFRANFGDGADVLVSAEGHKFYMPIFGRLIIEAQ